jgi:hypothetical protein
MLHQAHFDVKGGEPTFAAIAKPTLAAVALLHLKRTAAISAVESHLIERVNGRFGPEVSFAQTEPALSLGTAANSNS